MAGHRRKTGRPMVRRARAQRQRAQLQAELAAAGSPADRVAAAADYVRAALRRHPAAGQVAEQVVAQLIEAGDRIHRHDDEEGEPRP